MFNFLLTEEDESNVEVQLILSHLMLALDVFLQLGEIPSLTVDGLGTLLAPQTGHVAWRRGGG